jgi:hypothetical protein
MGSTGPIIDVLPFDLTTRADIKLDHRHKSLKFNHTVSMRFGSAHAVIHAVISTCFALLSGAYHKGGSMKRIIGVLLLALCVSAPSFAAEHIVTRSGKFVGKETYKTVKTVGKGGVAVLKFLF